MPMEKLRSTIAGERLFARAAEYDSAGNRIVDTYATKSDLTDVVMEAEAPLKIVDGDNGKKVTNNGVGLTVTGNNAWAEGSYTTASGNSSHAEGDYTFATGAKAHAEGETTTASAARAHAEGWLSTASEVAAHAEGYSTTASGSYSHAQGQGTVASGTSSCAMGNYNSDSAGLLVVGNGTSVNDRSDCFKVDSSGDTHVMLGSTLTNLNEYLTPDEDDMITVTIPNTALVGDRLYRTVIIGNQEWFAENLDWKFEGCAVGGAFSSGEGARANYYNNDEATYGYSGNQYGLLYNWYCVAPLNDLLEDGWHVPTDSDWQVLQYRESDIGKKLKATSGWNADNGTDYYGFTGVPSGSYTSGRDGTGAFGGVGDSAMYISATDHSGSVYEYSLNDSNYFSQPDVLYYVDGIAYSKHRAIRLVRDIV